MKSEGEKKGEGKWGGWFMEDVPEMWQHLKKINEMMVKIKKIFTSKDLRDVE